jgi:hypothetical protein
MEDMALPFEEFEARTREAEVTILQAEADDLGIGETDRQGELYRTELDPVNAFKRLALVVFDRAQLQSLAAQTRALERSSNADLVDSEMSKPTTGEMAEWLKAHAWKACIPQGIQGSNPCLSASHL